MLIRMTVVFCLLISIVCSNGLFENHHEKDEDKMAVTRWRRSAGHVETRPRRDSVEVEGEMEENRMMTLKNSQHHLAGTRRRYGTPGHPSSYRAGLVGEGAPALRRVDSRRHAVHSQAVAAATTTTHIPPSTTPTPPTSTSTTPPSTPPTSTSSPSPPPTSSLPLITNNPPPNTMSETMESYFRPIDLNVPQDHLRPFQEFGKKLTRGHAPSTTINTNTLEVTSNRPKDLDLNLNNRSNLEDELNEDMDVAYSKPFTEQNKASRPHHIMFIKHGLRRPQPSRSVAQHEQGGVRLVQVTETLTEGSVEVTTSNIQRIPPEVTPKSIVEDKTNKDSANESNNVFYVQALPPKTTQKTEKRGDKSNQDGSDNIKETSREPSWEEGNQTLIKEVNKTRAGEKESVIQLVGVLKTLRNDSEVPTSVVEEMVTSSLAPVVEDLATGGAAEEKSVDKAVPFKTVFPGSRNGTGFVLLSRRRGWVYGTKKNVSSTNKTKPITPEEVRTRTEDKENDVTTKRGEENLRTEAYENFSKSPKLSMNRNAFGEKQAESPSNDQQVENTITKHVRGNATYKSQLLKNSRTPKTLQLPLEVVTLTSKQNLTSKSEQLRQTETSTLKTPPKQSDAENPTSKILSTAVVTSISVLGEWTPMIPFLEAASNATEDPIDSTTIAGPKTTHIMLIPDHVTQPTVIVANITSTHSPAAAPNLNVSNDNAAPAIQTKESMQVSYSRNVPKQPVSNSSLFYLTPNQSTFINEVIKNLTGIQQVAESVLIKDTRSHVGSETGTVVEAGPKLGNETELGGFRNRKGLNTTHEVIVENSDQESQQVSNIRGSKSTKFDEEVRTNTKDGEESEQVEVKTEVPPSTTLSAPTTDPPRQEDATVETVTSLTPGDETTTVTNTTPESSTENSSRSPTIQRQNDVEAEQVVVNATGASSGVEDTSQVVINATGSTDEVQGTGASSKAAVNATGILRRDDVTDQVDVNTTGAASEVEGSGQSSMEAVNVTDSLSRDGITRRVDVNATGEIGITVSPSLEITTDENILRKAEEEIVRPSTPRATKPPRVVNIGEREKTRVVYHTEEEEVSSRPGQEGTPDNDVATYILGTFGLIPIAIAVLLSVKYCISRRKKIWESEKSPLTFVTTNEWEFPRSKLRLQTVLGQGNFGQVYKAEADDILGERATRLVAVKTIKDGGSAQEKEDLMRELAILKQIGAHSNVVTLLGCCTEKEPYYLILEYVMYGKLLSFLRDNRTRRQYYNFSEETAELTAKDLTSFAYCVARGMEYLTSKGIIHRDLAARNILVDHNKICKVADFGMSRSVSDPGEVYEQTRSKGALPIRWMAPESLLYRIFTHKSDVWAFGILMWEIVTLGSTPYQTMSAREVIKQVRDGFRLERPDHCRPELYRVAARCWSHDPSKRPTFGEVKMELAALLEQGEPQTYVDLDSYIESISGSNSRTKQTTQVVNL